jgi:hypothetical protein
MTDIIVIDNFFENPHDVREAALNKRFDHFGRYPGMRTAGVDDQQSCFLKNKFETILHREIKNWTNCPNGKGDMNTCYQLCLEYDESWVHHDGTEYAAVVYLTPDPDLDSGTGFFLHKKHKISRWDRKDDSTDMNKNSDLTNQEEWVCHAEVKNVFNRLVLYRGEMYHRSMKPGFARNYIEGRLTQVFFFDTNDFDK